MDLLNHLHTNHFIDWVHNDENFFDYLEISKDRQVKLIAYKLKGGASALWEHLQITVTDKENKVIVLAQNEKIATTTIPSPELRTIFIPAVQKLSAVQIVQIYTS